MKRLTPPLHPFPHKPCQNAPSTNTTPLDRPTREKALCSLRTYLTSTHKFTPLELLKIWKALFFCLSPPPFPTNPSRPLPTHFPSSPNKDLTTGDQILTWKKLLNRHVPHRKSCPPNPPLPNPFLPPTSPTPLPLHPLPARLLHHPHQPIPFPPSTSPRQIPIPYPPLHCYRLHIPIPTFLAPRIDRCLYRIDGKRHRPSLKRQRGRKKSAGRDEVSCFGCVGGGAESGGGGAG